jgi:hypothetical protein
MHTVTPNRPDRVELAIAEKRCNEALRRVTRNATLPEYDSTAENLRRDINRHRIIPTRHILTVLWNAKTRKASREDVKAFAMELLAVVDDWFDAEEGKLPAAFGEVLIKEETVEGVREVKETILSLNPKCPSAARSFLEASNEYREAEDGLRQYAEAVIAGRVA